MMMRTILLHIAVLCFAYEVVQGLPQLCASKDFKLNENKKGAKGCIVDICDGKIFRSHECSKLRSEQRCDDEDLKHEKRKAACQCCNLVAMMQLSPVMLTG